MKKSLLIPVLLLYTTGGISPAQPQNERMPVKPAYPSQATQKAYMAGNYLAPIVEFRERRKELLDPAASGGSINNIPMRGLYLQTYGSFSAEVGNYREAIESFDEDKGTTSPPIRDAESQKEELGKCQPHDAVRVIREMADKHQAIFINEAHHMPQHRAFTLSLLRDLWEKGFRYFAAETLSPDDKELGGRGYPIMSKTGYYSNEPVYADLIRTAVQLGYKIIPYEYDGRIEPKPEEKLNFQQRRDKGQAQNLYDRIFKHDPAARLVVHAGYAHVYEKATASWHPMALYFRQLTGIDPLTIDQTVMTEHSAPHFENPVYRYAMDRWKPAKPMVFRSAQGDFFTGGNLKGFVDVQIFSPRSDYRDGRPTWLLLSGARDYHRESISDLKQDFPYLVQAAFASEGADAVPIDQIEVKTPGRTATLILPGGSFIIRVKNRAGDVVRSSRIEVKRR